MQIRILYINQIISPDVSNPDINPNKYTFTLRWMGKPQDLGITHAKDEAEILGKIFNHFDKKRPKNFPLGPHNRHTITLGDIIGLDNKFYLCKFQGWQYLREFDIRTNLIPVFK